MIIISSTKGLNLCFNRLSSHVLYALHDIVDSEGRMQVLVTHSQSPVFSAVFVISTWTTSLSTPAIYASAHLIGNESLPTFKGRNPTAVEGRLEPRLLADSKYAHQRRAMIVKSRRGDDAIMIGMWTGRRKGITPIGGLGW